MIRQVRAAMPGMTEPHRRQGRSGIGDVEPTAAGPAAAASAAVFARDEGLIDEVSRKLALTPKLRASAIPSVRQRQTAESGAASKAIMGDAQAGARMRRKIERGEACLTPRSSTLSHFGAKWKDGKSIFGLAH